jgi:hypothetical protein
MGSMILRALEARLTRLEARVAAIPDPEEQKEARRVFLLHQDAWLVGGSLEDVPVKDRDPSTWEILSEYGPLYLKMIWEGILDGRDELLAAGVDFTRLEGVDEDDVAAVRAPGLPGPDVHLKLGKNLSLSEGEG